MSLTRKLGKPLMPIFSLNALFSSWVQSICSRRMTARTEPSQRQAQSAVVLNQAGDSATKTLTSLVVLPCFHRNMENGHSHSLQVEETVSQQAPPPLQRTI